MHKITYQSGAAKLTCGEHTAERTQLQHGMEAVIDALGAHRARPPHYGVQAARTMRPTRGELTFMQMALSALESNVLARALDQHAKITATLRKQVGNRRVPVQQLDLQRVQVVGWSLSWRGGGAENLHRADFRQALS